MPRLPPRKQPHSSEPAPGRTPNTLETTVARAVESPLVRGGLTITVGILAGNLLGFARVATTAYLLGTGDDADALAVAIGPLDTLNQVLISSLIYAFVPMLTARGGQARIALFLRLRRSLGALFLVLSGLLIGLAPQVIQWAAPGLAASEAATAAAILRIGALSALAVGLAAVHTALLYTDRRFGPTAFHQATLNAFTLACALALWKTLGVYAFALGYTVGAAAQLLIVWNAARPSLNPAPRDAEQTPLSRLMMRPASILLYSALIALNVTATRAFSTHLGPGTAAAFEYSMRCVAVPLAFLVSPVSNSMLPEIARLRSLGRVREAFKLADRTLAFVAAVAVAACLVGIAVREPVIALLFERGSFTPESTRMVSAVFLGFAPVLIGWSLLELTSRSVFALDRTALPLVAAALSLLVNLGLMTVLIGRGALFLGVGASLGFLAAFLALFLALRAKRHAWA